MLVCSVNSDARCAKTRGAITLFLMAKKPRKTLEKWQVDDAARLKALFEKREPKVSQVAFASDHGIGTTQGIVWQYLNAKIPLNLDVAVKFATGLKCDVAEFSPRLARKRALLSAHHSTSGALPYDIDEEEIHALLSYVEQLSDAQRKVLMKALADAAQANEVVKATLNLDALRHPEDTHVAKALHKGASRLPLADAQQKKVARRQLPLFGARPKREK